MATSPPEDLSVEVLPNKITYEYPSDHSLGPSAPGVVRVYAFTDLAIEIVWIDHDGRIVRIEQRRESGDA